MSPINNIYPLATGRLTFIATIPHGVKLEDILKPDYWANVTKKLTAHKSHIEADWEDGTRLVVLRVVGVGTNFAKVRVIQDFDFTTAAPAAVTASDIKAPSAAPTASTENADDFTVEWKGPSRKFSIIRKSDKAYVKDLFESKAEGEEWLAKYIKGEVKVEAKAA